MGEPLEPLSAEDYAREIGWAPPEPSAGTPHPARPGDTFVLKDVAIGSEVWFEFFSQNEPAFDGVIGPKPYGLVLPIVNIETVPGPHGDWTRVTGKMPNGRLVTREGNRFSGRRPPRPLPFSI